MGYRDVETAARERVRRAREAVERLEERITPALLERLEAEERSALMNRAARLAEHLPEALEGIPIDVLDAALPLLAAQRQALENAIAKAPRLAQRFNRLPTGFPERAPTRFSYEYMDIYQRATAVRREAIHRWVLECDPEATLLSARRGYDNHEEEPLLVEAKLTVAQVPVRLQVVAQHSAEAQVLSTCGFSLFVRVRPSTPALRVELEGLDDRFLKWLRLRSEPEIGDLAFDDTFFIHGNEEDARRVLRPAATEPLLALAPARRIGLEIGDGLAELRWMDPGSSPRIFDQALQALLAIRDTPGVHLLRGTVSRDGFFGGG